MQPSFARKLAPALLTWWDQHGRKDLPWQQIPPGNPGRYRVWVSEIMLQQTQVTTVLRYYAAFLAAFPDVLALANAEPDAVLHRWSGLGYYARARNLHRAAQVVRDEHGGEIPANFDQLAQLPGIGRSTAGAILSLADHQRHPILDGNVKRVLARVFRVAGYPGETAVAKQLWSLAEECTPAERVANYTQAIMDLGASLCARRKPACLQCPLAEGCLARREGVADQLPARKPPKARPRKAAVVLICVRPDGAVLLERRPNAGIWGGLWGLPETASIESAAGWCTVALGTAPSSQTVRPVLAHGFSHFDLDMTPVELRVDSAPDRVMEDDRWLWYKTDAPARIGLPAPIAKLLSSVGAP